MGLRGTGKAIAWLREHVAYDGDDCLIWPFCIDRRCGYGRLGYNGKMYWANRLMCEFVNGPPPTPEHESAHSCGRGNEGCVHPKHLSWKTPSQNQLDRREHGTAGNGGKRFTLTAEQVAEIRSLKGKRTQVELAKMFGMSWQHIGSILRGEVRKTGADPRRFTTEEVAAIRTQRGSRTTREIAADYGVGHCVIWRIQTGRRKLRASTE